MTTTKCPRDLLQADSPTHTATGGASRRRVLTSIGAVGIAGATLGHRAFAQGKAPIKLSFWTFENPQQRPWLHKRIKQFTDLNPNVIVDFQSFTFGDLGKKLSVGFATGTAPDGFATGDWLMPIWRSKNLIAPLDVTRLGYRGVSEFSADYPKAFVDGAVADGKVYGYPVWFYGYSNYLNARLFKEVGLDPYKDAPRTWQQMGEVAQRLAVKDGNKFTRQGFKFAMHSPLWTVIQFNPILQQCGGAFFDAEGKCIVNNAAGLKAMKIRTSFVLEYQAEDPADSIATQPLPGMDWLRERNAMFISHPLPLAAIKSQNQKMYDEKYFRAVRAPGVVAGEGFTTTYGFNLVVNAHASADKQAVLHDLYRFMLADAADCWADTAPFPLARKSAYIGNASVAAFPDIAEILDARDRGIALPSSLAFHELSDAMHKAVQRILLNNQSIQASLDEAATEVNRAIASNKKA